MMRSSFCNMDFFTKVFAALVVVGCSSEKGYDFAVIPVLTSFNIQKSLNSSLDYDIIAYDCNKDTIELFYPEVIPTDSLIPTFSGNFINAQFNGETIESSKDYCVFKDINMLEMIDENGNKTSKFIVLNQFHNLPIIRITTDNSLDVDSKDKKIKCSVLISNVPNLGGAFSDCKISLRGNGTAYYEKRPYKIKLKESACVLNGLPNKDWLLLADYNDRSMLRTAYMFEISKALGIEYTPYYEYVDLFLNNDYKGLYLLTDKIERSKHRINIPKDGFIIEDDNHYSLENLWFTTELFNLNYTFKYPDASDGEIVEDDNSFIYIRQFMDELEYKLMLLEDDSDNIEYMQYIDLNSFAKWYILGEITANADANQYYVLSRRGGQLKKMPIWDSEWSLGIMPAPVVPSGVFDYDKELHRNNIYFKYLFKSPFFVAKIKEEWESFKMVMPQLMNKMESIHKRIESAQDDNLKRWPNISFKLSFYFDNCSEETNYLKTFFENRLAWFDQYIKSIGKENE